MCGQTHQAFEDLEPAEWRAIYDANVASAVNVLQAARQCRDTKAIVNVTSDKCYENRETGQHYRESDPMGGHDPYSSSKGCAELVTAAYRVSFFAGGAGVASARAGNVIGGGDWADDRLVPDLVRGALKGAATLIRNPTAVRPWQHVLEPLACYLQLAEHLYELMQEDGAATDEPYRLYLERLQHLTAENWRAG